MILFAANLTFIVTHLYGWLLKWFYKPKAYREHFHELFPAQRAVGLIYLLQLFELPYLLQIGDDDALLYVNTFALMCFSFQMLVMCEGYFFPKQNRPLPVSKGWVWVFLPAVAVVLPLLVQAVCHFRIPSVFGFSYRLFVFVAVTIVFAYYFWLNIRMALKIGRAIRQANEDTYADSDDFPLQFAQFIQWVPTLLLLLLAINFYADDPWVKFGRDLLFTGFSVAFCIYTLNPWRKGISSQAGKAGALASGRGAGGEALFDNLVRRLDLLLTEERIFTEQHITIDTLVSRLGTNSKYLTEVIRRSGYQSFYDMISQHRVRHAIALIHQNPGERLADIAIRCGFSSSASMTKAFASQGKDPPPRHPR